MENGTACARLLCHTYVTHMEFATRMPNPTDIASGKSVVGRDFSGPGELAKRDKRP